jgi:hypothetical protein
MAPTEVVFPSLSTSTLTEPPFANLSNLKLALLLAASVSNVNAELAPSATSLRNRPVTKDMTREPEMIMAFQMRVPAMDRAHSWAALR